MTGYFRGESGGSKISSLQKEGITSANGIKLKSINEL